MHKSAKFCMKFREIRKIRKQNPNFKETTEEFLSRWHPDDRLVPVITVTIYFGNDGWDAAKSLQEMFSETDESLKEFLPDYKLHLISCNNISDFTKFHTEFGRLMHILKVISDEEQMDILLSDRHCIMNMRLILNSKQYIKGIFIFFCNTTF